jgi:hypothetical protein
LPSVLIVLLFTAACAEKGPILLDVGYRPREEKVAVSAKTAVAVSPLKDGRAKPASVLGIKTVSGGPENDLVVRGTVADMATAALKNALAHRGIAVRDAPAWDLTAQGIKAEGNGLLLGGEITALWLESNSVPFKTSFKAAVQVRIVAGDVAAGKIIRTVNISSTIEQEVLYSREKLEELMSEALSSAMEQLFKDDELRQRLQ